MFAKGVTLSFLERQQDAVAVYEAIEERYGADAPRVQRWEPCPRVETGKLHGPEKAIAVYEAIEARYGADSSPGVREH
ncbi:MAG: hypothetical protein IPJ18_19170 [Betaproteobacteria bacterium]|nr:hypothetical protein [Betaproteobacteria bacterium]